MNFFILSAWHWVGKGLNIEIQMIHEAMSANIKYNVYHIIQMLFCNVSLLKMCCWWLLIPFFQILYAFFIVNQCFLYKFEMPIMFLLMFYLQIFIIMRRMFPEKKKAKFLRCYHVLARLTDLYIKNEFEMV